MADILKGITELAVRDIAVEDRLRPVSEAGVETIVASIGELGVMKDPIHVRKLTHRGGAFVLLAGGHRLEAAKRLGWERIAVTCWRCSDDFARLMEIDDNLAGAELTPLDTAVFLAERKRVYEKLHPGTRAATGAALVAKRWDTADTMSAVSFAKVTAEKFGISERHVRRLARAGDVLERQDAARLRAAKKQVPLKDLLELSKVIDAPERAHVIDCLSEGRARSASEARKQWKAERGEGPAPLSPADAAFHRLRDAWTRAPKKARDMFLDRHGAEISELLASREEGGDA